MKKVYSAALFDLDGVIVDTAKYHYLAWSRLATELGFTFTKKDNERLKGVSRVRSLEILLEIGGLTLPADEQEMLAAKKNDWYVEYLVHMDDSELLEGSRDCLIELCKRGVKTALGSASKNAPLILERLHISELFDEIVDGNSVIKTKPDPEVFMRGAELLGVPYEQCVVFEDAQAGIDAAIACRMGAVGIGDPQNLIGADICIPGLHSFDPDDWF